MSASAEPRAHACAGCGAPLVEPATGATVACEYCRRVHTFNRAAPRRGHATYAVDATVTPGADRRAAGIANAPYAKGQQVDVEWNGRWYDATVKDVTGADSFEIHYDGWSSSWDETVGRSRIRPRTAKRSRSPSVWASVGLVAVLAVTGALVASRSSGGGTSPTATYEAGPAPGRPYDGSPLEPGQRILVLWGSTYWDAEVLSGGNGTYRIHYVGYGASYDEDVGPDRIRLP